MFSLQLATLIFCHLPSIVSKGFLTNGISHANVLFVWIKKKSVLILIYIEKTTEHH